MGKVLWGELGRNHKKAFNIYARKQKLVSFTKFKWLRQLKKCLNVCVTKLQKQQYGCTFLGRFLSPAVFRKLTFLEF